MCLDLWRLILMVVISEPNINFSYFSAPLCPSPHLAAIGRKNKIYTQIQFPERPWRNENLFGFQEYHLCPDPRHFLIDSGAGAI